jgi:hypothetical protein
MGLRNLPSKTWMVNCGWVRAANIAADLAAWCRLLGLYDQQDLKDAEPGTLRPAAEPARPARPPRPAARAEDQPHLALEGGIPGLLAAAVRPARTRLTSHPCSCDPERRPSPAQSEPVPPGHTGPSAIRREHANQIQPPKTGATRPVTDLAPPLNR